MPSIPALLRFFQGADQALVDGRLGLVVAKDGRWVRATTPQGTALFPCADPAAFLRGVQQAVDKVRLIGSATAVDSQPVGFTTPEFDQLRLAIALHWARYCLSTGSEIDLQPHDLTHPQTWAIVLAAAQRKYGAGSAQALALAAHVLQTSVAELARWREVEDERLSNK